ncbi:MAG: hypothetical protein ABGY71_12015 [bacterium]|jgi:hypothetical protein|nr:hypothetical protein [Planctomycetota bacterium]HIL51070.1 hypothetical protein [Planctomycetota bacterium]
MASNEASCAARTPCCASTRLWAESSSTEPSYARALHGVSHFSLRIADRSGWEQTIADEELELLYGGLVEWPHSLAWYVADPTGYEIGVALWNDDTVRFG